MSKANGSNGRWSSFGAADFRDIGVDPTPAGERYGFRAFQVMVTTSRGSVTKIAGNEHRGLLRLVNHPMNGKLAAIHREYVYGPGINIAACQPSNGPAHHTAPHVLEQGTPHGCGFYAYGAADHADAQPPKNGYANNLNVYAQAVVAGSGYRIVGTKGFLSEKLRIVAIAFPLECSLNNSHKGDGQNTYDLFGPRLERLVRANYPDAAIFDSVEAMIANFPLTTMPQRSEEAS